MASTVDDAALIARVLLDDDRHAFSTLVRRHQSPVRAFLIRLCCGERAAADDLAQETFLRAYRSLASYRQRGNFVSWLFALAYRAFLSERRRAHHSRESHSEEQELADPRPPSTTPLLVDLEKAMAFLRPEERAAISLCAQWGLSHEEAAEVMDCPIGTVKTHILRGKQKLSERLSAYNPQSSGPSSSAEIVGKVGKA